MMLLLDLGLLVGVIAIWLIGRYVRDRMYLAKVRRSDAEVVGMSIEPASFVAIDPGTGRIRRRFRRPSRSPRYLISVRHGAATFTLEVDARSYRRFEMRGIVILIHRTHRRSGKIVPLDVFPCFDS